MAQSDDTAQSAARASANVRTNWELCDWWSQHVEWWRAWRGGSRLSLFQKAKRVVDHRNWRPLRDKLSAQKTKAPGALAIAQRTKRAGTTRRLLYRCTGAIRRRGGVTTVGRFRLAAFASRCFRAARIWTLQRGVRKVHHGKNERKIRRKAYPNSDSNPDLLQFIFRRTR